MFLLQTFVSTSVLLNRLEFIYRGDFFFTYGGWFLKTSAHLQSQV